MTKPCFLCAKVHCSHRYVTLKQLMSFTPEQLTMDEHRLKGFFIRLRKKMKRDEAWKKAILEVRRVTSRSQYIWPEFSRKDRAKINRYRPTSDLQDISYWK